MTRLLLALFAILPLICSAEIYKWTGESGRVHFGDKPKDKDQAEQLSPKINSYESVSYESFTPAQGATSQRVIMYSAAWCGYCKQARQYFRRNGISFVEYDIEKNQNARRAYNAIGGNGVPVILVGSKRLNGFTTVDFQSIYP
ncbi:glutaredoxin family protein [Ectopseudomonas mendocina]|nr:glutaredoxin family protein [Pseudomonas mendocina]TRO11369.1 glutaredoxin family protein [Pseudomonas mendocina]TRO19782.1 glutaredoxin family protein [Pseudomonas mendocina]